LIKLLVFNSMHGYCNSVFARVRFKCL